MAIVAARPASLSMRPTDSAIALRRGAMVAIAIRGLLAAGFVDANGDPIDPARTEGRTATPVTQNGESVAVVVHDDGLNTDPELVDVAGKALLLAVENDRLQRELY